MQAYDYVIVGSGFGGAVASLRLIEKGYKVLLIEAGRRFDAKDFPKTNWNIRKSLYFRPLGLNGILKPDFFRSILVMSGTGYGGGSLGYANTLIRPSEQKWKSTRWAAKPGLDWQDELSTYYDTAGKMLGVTTAPDHYIGDKFLKNTAELLGYSDTYSPVPVGVYIGKPGVKVEDPYFDGKGPSRSGCISCGGCMVGCRHDAKNTLDKNYLYLAENMGLEVRTNTKATLISKEGDLFIVHTNSAGFPFQKKSGIVAKNVIVAAGVMGTLRLLFKSKENGHLPSISESLGSGVCTNNESFHGVRMVNDDHNDCSKGLSISSSVNPDHSSKIEIVRFPSGSSLLAFLVVPYVTGKSIINKTMKVILKSLFSPGKVFSLLRFKKWSEQSLIFMVMQSLETKCRILYKRRIINFFRKDIDVAFESGSLPPVYIEQGLTFAKKLAESENLPQTMSISELFNQRLTAHILGGCPMGTSRHDSVIDFDHQVHGYKGLYVLGGASVPGNLGVNPSLTITAMAERAISIISKNSSEKN